MRKLRAFDAFGAAPAVVALVAEVLSPESWRADQAWGPALVTFPRVGPWTLPPKVWHFDLPGRGDPDTAQVIRLFGYVSDVVSRGGATLVVEGSHELVCRMAAVPDHDAVGSADLRKKLLTAGPWFRALEHRALRWARAAVHGRRRRDRRRPRAGGRAHRVRGRRGRQASVDDAQLSR